MVAMPSSERHLQGRSCSSFLKMRASLRMLTMRMIGPRRIQGGLSSGGGASIRTATQLPLAAMLRFLAFATAAAVQAQTDPTFEDSAGLGAPNVGYRGRAAPMLTNPAQGWIIRDIDGNVRGTGLSDLTRRGRAACRWLTP